MAVWLRLKTYIPKLYPICMFVNYTVCKCIMHIDCMSFIHIIINKENILVIATFLAKK